MRLGHPVRRLAQHTARRGAPPPANFGRELADEGHGERRGKGGQVAAAAARGGPAVRGSSRRCRRMSVTRCRSTAAQRPRRVPAGQQHRSAGEAAGRACRGPPPRSRRPAGSTRTTGAGTARKPVRGRVGGGGVDHVPLGVLAALGHAGRAAGVVEGRERVRVAVRCGAGRAARSRSQSLARRPAARAAGSGLGGQRVRRAWRDLRTAVRDRTVSTSGTSWSSTAATWPASSSSWASSCPRNSGLTGTCTAPALRIPRTR